MNRLEFLKVCGATAGASLAGWFTGSSLFGRALAAAAVPETVTLKSWELVELPGLPPKLRPLMKITGSNGAVGYAKPVAKDFSAAAEAAKGVNLLDHDKLYDAMIANNAPKGEIATLDIACWDLHARMLGKPLHAMLGTKRQEEKGLPIVEFPMGEDVPKEFMSGPWLLAPDWPGIYRVEA